jgi:hypothetical protein
MATGVIMTAVAVLDIHIDMHAVAAINPRIMPAGLWPNRVTMFNAMRLCRFQRSMVAPKKNPDKNKKTISFPNSPAADFKGMMPQSGKSTKGKRAVMATGTTSLIHQKAIHHVMPAANQAISGMPAGAGSNTVHKNPVGPEKSNMRCVFTAQT